MPGRGTDGGGDHICNPLDISVIVSSEQVDNVGGGGVNTVHRQRVHDNGRRLRDSRGRGRVWGRGHDGRSEVRGGYNVGEGHGC